MSPVCRNFFIFAHHFGMELGMVYVLFSPPPPPPPSPRTKLFDYELKVSKLPYVISLRLLVQSYIVFVVSEVLVEKRWAGAAQSVWRLATGWAVRGSNPGGGEIFRTRSERPWAPPRLLYNGHRVFPGVKRLGAWRWPTTLSSAEVKEGVELYLYSTGLSWAFTWRTLPLPLLEKRQTYIPTYLCIGMCYLRINLCVLHEGEMGEWSYRSIYSKPWLWVQVTDQLPTSRPFASAEGTKLGVGWAPGSLWASWMSKGHFRSSSQ